jgi:hypothetical protein
MPPIVRDVLLVALGVVLAVAAESWRDARAEQRRSAYAIAGIRTELEENRERVARARANHLAMADTLTHYLQRHELPPRRVYFGGVFNPAHTLSTAWQTARATGALDNVPYMLVLFLGGAYESQESYRSLGSALAQSTMAEMQRRGVLPVYRDGFANFIPIEQDFATREGVLGGVYDAALHALDTAGYGPVVGAVHAQRQAAPH